MERTLSYRCPSCSEVIEVAARLAGQPYRCPHCDEPTQVPSEPGTRAIWAMFMVLVLIGGTGYALAGWQAGVVVGVLTACFTYLVVKQTGPEIKQTPTTGRLADPISDEDRERAQDPSRLKRTDRRSRFRPRGFQ